MLTNVPTWTTDRVELLKSGFDSRPHLPRDRSQHRRQPQRGNRQTRPPPVDARPGACRTAPDQGRPGAHRGNPFPGLQYRILQAVLRRRTRRCRRSRSRASAAARCSNSATNGAAGRSARPAPRISAFAATRRWKACPIARATTASPIVRARARARCARIRRPRFRARPRARSGLGLRKHRVDERGAAVLWLKQQKPRDSSGAASRPRRDSSRRTPACRPAPAFAARARRACGRRRRPECASDRP